MKIKHLKGYEFDIMVPSASGPPHEPDDWWRFWFQASLHGIMKIKPPPPRTYFFRLITFTDLPAWAMPASFDLMSTCWNGEEEFRQVAEHDTSISNSPDLIRVNLIENEPLRLAGVLLKFAAALVHEFVHVTKHAASHKDHRVECEDEAADEQRKFILRGAETFGVPPAERDLLISLHDAAQKARRTDLSH